MIFLQRITSPIQRRLLSSLTLNRRLISILPSFSSKNLKSYSTNASPTTPIGKLEKQRMLIGFTCNKCNTRSYKFMSKKAYQQGVVIIKCDGCKSKHLIADHLGWFDSTKNTGTIEDIMKEKGETVEKLTLDPADLLNSNHDGIDSNQLKELLGNASEQDLKEIEEGLMEFTLKK
jgi:hypothetical protein